MKDILVQLKHNNTLNRTPKTLLVRFRGNVPGGAGLLSRYA
jgi:hypothetical protein